MTSSISRRRLIALGLAWTCLAPSLASAQLTVQGVYVDPDGVLRYRQTGNVPAFRPNARQPAATCAISLPKLFAELRRLTEARQRIPDALRFLDGMVQLQSIHVDEVGHDLILVGVAEPFDPTAARPRGQRTGRPVLQLDDLVTALRALGPGARSRTFGCTLEQAPEAVGRVANLQPRLGRTPAETQALFAAAMREAVGPLEAKFFGVPADSRLAAVCIESDYLMKRLSLGLDPAPPGTIRSYLSQSTGKSVFNRFWFTAKYEPLLVSADGLHFEIRGQGLQVLASDSPTQTGTENPPAQKFAEDFTTHFPRLEAAIPAFADLHNVTDLAVLAALLAQDRLPEKAGWDPAWVLDAAGYQPAKVAVPKEAETLVNTVTKGRRTVACVGGVQLDAAALVQDRQPGQPPAVGPRIPAGAWSARTP